MPPRNRIPPVPRTATGEVRRIGVELELSGLTMASIVDIVTEHFGGNVDTVSDFEHVVKDSRVGEFRVELDFEYLKNLRHAPPPEVGLRGDVHRLSVEAMAEVARLVVPMEIVSPPMEPQRLEDIDAMVATLRSRGGRGTRHSAIYAFGLHLNPEVPALDAQTLLRYLRAFLCLYDWLVLEEKVDWSRRVTPYINPFPTNYVLRVLAPGYAPGMEELIDDYLADNADRNRALDLLPLFAHIDEARVRAAIDDPRIKPRPTFHYRLPNCDVDRPDWDVTAPWQNWLAVERLAEDPERLAAMGAEFRAHVGSLSHTFTREWATRSRTWLP